MEDWSPYQLPLQAASAAVQAAIRHGVQTRSVPPPAQAAAWLDTPEAPANGVWRDPDGRVLVSCVTDLPGVTPAMVDWWFGWHLPETARYRLWHPRAHVKAVVQEDRSHLHDDRARYIGNVSHVDEYIGRRLKKLSIAFVPPASLGLQGLDARGATAICAHTSDRILHSEGGSLVHLVLPTPNGAQMRSAFWLGEIHHHLGAVQGLLGGLLNTAAVRRRVVSDRMALDLLQHCGEEMQHLGRFLPALYAQLHGEPQGRSAA